MENKQRNPFASRDRKPKITAKHPKRQEKPRLNKKHESSTKRVTDEVVSGTGERIQKVLSRGGLGSRREIERWIDEGRLKINGVLAMHGAHLKAGDYLQLNERVVHWD
ncbi:MAG: hypothetical protein RL674_1542, partial [Pseudomonadota bacterium]